MRVKFVWALLVVLLGIISCKSKNSHDACDGLLKLECRQEGYLCKWDPTASKCIEIIEPYSGCESLTMEGCLNNGVCQWSSFFKGGTCVSRTTGIFYSSCAEVTNLSHCQGSTCRILNGKCASSSPVDLAESCSIFTPEGCFVFGVDSGCYLNRITGKCLSATNGAEIRSCSDVQEIDYCKNKCDWFPTLDINKCQYKCEKYWFKSSCEKLTDTSGESICKWKGNTYWGTCEKPNPSLEPKEHEIDPCEGVDTENNLCKSYCSSCGNCFEGSSGKLRCLCSTQNGGLNYSEINLKSCPVNKPIQNEGGVLTCADNPENMKDCSEIQPKKGEVKPCVGLDSKDQYCRGYCETCNNCFQSSAGNLRCLCPSNSGELNYTEIDVNTCPNEKPVENKNGVLTCAENPSGTANCAVNEEQSLPGNVNATKLYNECQSYGTKEETCLAAGCAFEGSWLGGLFPGKGCHLKTVSCGPGYPSEACIVSARDIHWEIPYGSILDCKNAYETCMNHRGTVINCQRGNANCQSASDDVLNCIGIDGRGSNCRNMAGAVTNCRYSCEQNTESSMDCTAVKMVCVNSGGPIENCEADGFCGSK